MALWTIIMQRKDKIAKRLWSLWCLLMIRGEFQSRWSFSSCSSFSVTNGLLQTEGNCTWLTRAKTSDYHLLSSIKTKQTSLSSLFLPFCSCRSLRPPFSFLIFSSQVHSRNRKQKADLQSKQCRADWYKRREKEKLSLHDWVWRLQKT